MKFLTPLFVVITLIFTSCASDETSVEQLKDDNLLKSYKVSRDVYGKYSINYELSKEANVDYIKNAETNTNEIYLFAGNVAIESSQKENLVVEDEQIKVDFYEEGSEEREAGIIIEDDGVEDINFLEVYTIESLGDDTYELSFTVRDGVTVWFEYNETDDVYEVHLKEGASKTLSYTQTYVKTADILKIKFVNYLYSDDTGAKGTARSYIRDKPVVVAI